MQTGCFFGCWLQGLALIDPYSGVFGKSLYMYGPPCDCKEKAEGVISDCHDWQRTVSHLLRVAECWQMLPRCLNAVDRARSATQ